MTEQERNRFGLTDRDMKAIYSIFSAYPELRVVHLFGSRAKGNYRLGSDVDLAIMNDGITTRQIAKIRNDFDESNLPYKIDLVDFTRLEKQEFIDHIVRVGIPFYTRNEKIHLS
jgi:uncharacterized protein